MHKLACPGCKEFLILLPEPQYHSFLIWREWSLRDICNGSKMLNLQSIKSRVYAGHLSTFQCIVLNWCASLLATLATMVLLCIKTILSFRVHPDSCPWSSQQFLKCLMLSVQNYCVVMWTLVLPFGLLGWIHCLVCCTAMLLALDSHPVECTVLCKCLSVQWPNQTHNSVIYNASTVSRMGFSCTHLTNRLFNDTVSFLLIFRVTRHNTGSPQLSDIWLSYNLHFCTLYILTPNPSFKHWIWSFVNSWWTNILSYHTVAL
jgi:hypothetical protein